MSHLCILFFHKLHLRRSIVYFRWNQIAWKPTWSMCMSAHTFIATPYSLRHFILVINCHVIRSKPCCASWWKIVNGSLSPNLFSWASTLQGCIFWRAAKLELYLHRFFINKSWCLSCIDNAFWRSKKRWCDIKFQVIFWLLLMFSISKSFYNNTSSNFLIIFNILNLRDWVNIYLVIVYHASGNIWNMLFISIWHSWCLRWIT